MNATHLCVHAHYYVCQAANMPSFRKNLGCRPAFLVDIYRDYKPLIAENYLRDVQHFVDIDIKKKKKKTQMLKGILNYYLKKYLQFMCA